MSRTNPRSRPAKKRKVSNYSHKRLHNALSQAMTQAKLGNGDEMKFYLKAARNIFPTLPAARLNNILNTYVKVVTERSNEK